MAVPKPLNVFRLEKYLIPPEEWSKHLKTIPYEGWKKLKTMADCGSVGLGKNSSLGYFIFVTAGQGPVFCWSEKL